MVGSKVADHRTTNDDDDGDAVSAKQQRLSVSSSDVSCSVCLDVVSDNGGRSRARLHCGHEFHLDCIGSAFNMKGAMQCPNCRKVEKGRWLYANGSTCSVPEFTVEEWVPDDEEPYDVTFPELPVRVHWCPFSGLTRLRSHFEEVESPSITYHGLQGHHIFTEQTAASSISHSYAAYVGRVPLPPPNATEIVEDPAYTPFHGVSVNNDIFGLNAFPPLDNQYQRWSHHSAQNGSHVNGADQASNSPATVRSNHGESPAIPRPGSSLHPFVLSQRSGPRARNGNLHHFPGGNRRIPGQPAFQPQQSSPSLGVRPPVVGIRRYSGTRSVPTASRPEHSGFYVFSPSSSSGSNLHEGENPLPTHVHGWNRFPASSASRDSSWSSFHLPNGGSESGNSR